MIRSGRWGRSGRSGSEAGISRCVRFLRCAVLIGAVVSSISLGAAVQGKTGEGDAAGEASAEAERPPTWYASSVSRSEGGAYVVIHSWSNGTRFRAETVLSGHRVTTIVNGGTYYIVDPVSATGVAIERSPLSVARDAERGRPFGSEFELILRDGGEKVRTESVSGRQCDVYRVTDEKGRRQVWVTVEKPPVPARAENFDRRNGWTTHVEYTNWLAGLSISDSFFEPDARIALERVGYEEYRARAAAGRPPGPAPVLYSDLLHGQSE